MAGHQGVVCDEVKVLRIYPHTDNLAHQFTWHRVAASVIDNQAGAADLAQGFHIPSNGATMGIRLECSCSSISAMVCSANRGGVVPAKGRHFANSHRLSSVKEPKRSLAASCQIPRRLS